MYRTKKKVAFDEFDIDCNPASVNSLRKYTPFQFVLILGRNHEVIGITVVAAFLTFLTRFRRWGRGACGEDLRKFRLILPLQVRS